MLRCQQQSKPTKLSLTDFSIIILVLPDMLLTLAIIVNCVLWHEEVLDFSML